MGRIKPTLTEKDTNHLLKQKELVNLLIEHGVGLENINGNPDKGFVKLKLRRDTTSSTSDLYEFKMSFFDNGKPEEFLLFVCNFNMTLAVSEMLELGAKYQYLSNIFRREALRQFDSLSSDIKSIQTLNFEDIIKGL